MENLIVTYSDRVRAKAAALLKDAQLVILPTETVYGIAADPTNEAAVKSLFNAKKRPDTKPLQIMTKDLTQAQQLGIFNNNALKLAHAFWPGALTIIIERRDDAGLCEPIFCGRDTIGIRVADHPIISDFLAEFGRPIAISSANISDEQPCIDATSAALTLQKPVAIIIDGGQCDIGISSTVVDCTTATPNILRQGSITAEKIAQALSA